jgi:hypothetical protein
VLCTIKCTASTVSTSNHLCNAVIVPTKWGIQLSWILFIQGLHHKHFKIQTSLLEQKLGAHTHFFFNVRERTHVDQPITLTPPQWLRSRYWLLGCSCNVGWDVFAHVNRGRGFLSPRKLIRTCVVCPAKGNSNTGPWQWHAFWQSWALGRATFPKLDHFSTNFVDGEIPKTAEGIQIRHQEHDIHTCVSASVFLHVRKGESLGSSKSSKVSFDQPASFYLPWSMNKAWLKFRVAGAESIVSSVMCWSSI